MRRYPDGTCPAEVYDREVAGKVLVRVYDSQEECARAHGCVRDACAIEESWLQPREVTKTRWDPYVASFIEVAFNGPGASAGRDASGSQHG